MNKEKEVKEEKFEVSKEEFDMLQVEKYRATDLAKEQTAHNQEWQLKQTAMQIKNLEREVTYKKAQISAKELKEKSDVYLSGKKPEFFLQNEIDEITLQIDKLRDTEKNIKHQQEEAAKAEEGKK